MRNRRLYFLTGLIVMCGTINPCIRNSITIRIFMVKYFEIICFFEMAFRVVYFDLGRSFVCCVGANFIILPIVVLFVLLL